MASRAGLDRIVTDLLFILITVGCFGLMVALVRAIEWIVGPEPVDLTPPSEPLAATDPRDDRTAGVTS